MQLCTCVDFGRHNHPLRNCSKCENSLLTNLSVPETGQLEERHATLAALQKSFLCSCPQSLEGLEGRRRCIGGLVGELGEVFFCTWSDQLSVTAGDLQLGIHCNAVGALVLVENWLIVSWSAQRRRGWRSASWASLPPEAPGEPRPAPAASPGSRSSRCLRRCCCCSSLPPLPSSQVFHNLFHFSPESGMFLQCI